MLADQDGLPAPLPELLRNQPSTATCGKRHHDLDTSVRVADLVREGVSSLSDVGGVDVEKPAVFGELEGSLEERFRD